MTQLVLNYSASLLEIIWENLKGFGKSFLAARQMSVNAEIARVLVQNGEYKDFHSAYTALNEGTLRQYGIK